MSDATGLSDRCAADPSVDNSALRLDASRCEATLSKKRSPSTSCNSIWIALRLVAAIVWENSRMAETDIFDSNEEHLPQDLGDDVVQEVLKTGTDLRQYSRQIEKELKEVENKSIQDYIKESENIAELHNQIAACDDILEVRIRC